MRLRRYISRNKDSRNKEGNLALTNSVLKAMGLKSLLGIKEQYARKRKRIFQETTDNKRKVGAFSKILEI
jgi:hypothetical protein